MPLLRVSGTASLECIFDPRKSSHGDVDDDDYVTTKATKRRKDGGGADDEQLYEFLRTPISGIKVARLPNNRVAVSLFRSVSLYFARTLDFQEGLAMAIVSLLPVVGSVINISGSDCGRRNSNSNNVSGSNSSSSSRRRSSGT